MKIDSISTYARTDLGYLAMIGKFVSQKRKERKRTQEDVANAAGVNRSTVQKIEKGESVNLLSLIQVLRVLEQLHVLDQFQHQELVSPLKLAEIEHKEIKRVRTKKASMAPKKNKKSDW